MSMTQDAPLLETAGLTRHFRIGGLFSQRKLHAVDDLDLAIRPREILAVVGESGSGKSTIARLLAKVYEPTAGQIRFRGRPVSSIRARRDLLAYRGAVPMVLQDPFASLNPVHTIGYVLERGLILHQPGLTAAEREAEAVRVLEAVGLSPARQVLAKYPHEMSGGQRQRIGFAQALSYKPSLVLADEPVSMLDVSIRIGVLNLMAQLCAEEGISFLYITHDIASARYVAHRILVMYAGRAVETGPTEAVLREPAHPYTRLLLSAVPDPRAPITLSAADTGEPPRVVDPGEGCRFRQRCPLAIARCAEVTPPLAELAAGHAAACHVTAPAG
ncbi:MAG TPA: ABC transporter ATP-binding protein [Acidisoma sp.]|jgi:peptide/nickel transport system ATP-binding protein|uniref:ABC transporter ATP-binding protein n=1 Tax=Acidisoma sp. TaxID=1872115 RepID=UPI002C27D0E7|nr:ABC transporter ATP-binding protein [Acidisoma sp.]HTH99447.1 ABC transporter ATP-binding protein [Acidisoma sp.]